MRAITPLLAVFALFGSPASAAYVQHQSCDSAPANSFDAPVDSLSANLAAFEPGLQLLTWKLGLLVNGEEECESLARNVSATVSTTTLFGTTYHDFEPFATCFELPGQVLTASHQLSLSLEENVNSFFPLATFHSEIQVDFAHNDKVLCTQANVTPSVGNLTRSLLRWVPVSIFLFVLAVGILRTCFNRPIRLGNDQDMAEASRPSRPVLPHVGDCLQYLQFIFLTGSLSLRYPGFYQPAVSNLNWFSLLLTGPITQGFVYPSVSDGIYEINGTYGGTYGLEIMHQIVGAPTTMSTWVNMSISVGIITVSAALILEGAHQLMLKSGGTTLGVPHQETPFSKISFRVTRVLRVVFSFFLLPIISISCYQFDNAAWLPGYHTSLATLFLVFIIVAFFWLLCQIPVRSLGMLVFDSKRYHHLSTLSASNSYGKLFIMIIFVLSFIRGVAIGGLQISAPAQLAVLGSAEIVLLVTISGLQAYPLWSIGTVSAVLRLLTVGLLMVFLPSFEASLRLKSLIGYTLLAIHGSMLVCGFLIPSVYSACLLIVRSCATPKPEAYSLRDLQRRRGTSSTDVLRFSDAARSPRLSSNYHSPNLSRHSQAFDPSPRQEEFSHRPSHYFRPPRPTSVASYGFEDNRTKKMEYSLSTRTAASTASSSESSARVASPRPNPKPTTQLTVVAEPAYDTQARSSESTLSSLESAGSASTSVGGSNDGQSRPLGPRWNDYSFREADLYYLAGQAGQPIPEDEEAEERPQDQVPGWRMIRKASSGLWSRVVSAASTPPVEERGFSVVRPSRPPQGPYAPSHGPQSPFPESTPSSQQSQTCSQRADP